MREIPVFDSLELLIQYLLKEVLKYDSDRLVRMSFDGNSVLMFVTESEIPINISYHTIYSEDLKEHHDEIMANVCAELLQMDLGVGWLSQLDEICRIINKNTHIFEKIIERR